MRAGSIAALRVSDGFARRRAGRHTTDLAGVGDLFAIVRWQVPPERLTAKDPRAVSHTAPRGQNAFAGGLPHNFRLR